MGKDCSIPASVPRILRPTSLPSVEHVSRFALLEKGKSLISVIAKQTMRVILKRLLVSPRAITEPPSQGQELFDFDVDRFVRDFCHRHRSELRLWGEAAVPQLLAYYWLWRVTDATLQAERPLGLSRLQRIKNHAQRTWFWLAPRGG